MTDGDVITETWKPIPGARHFEASDQAHDTYGIRSLDRTLGGKFYPGQLRKAGKSGKSRYWQVKIRDDEGREVYRTVQRLVLLAHVGPCPPGMEACHADDNPDNNRLSNLRWDYPSGNDEDWRRNHPPKPKPAKTCVLCGREFTGHRNARRCQDCVAGMGREYAERVVATQSAEKAAEGFDYPLAGLLNLAVKYGGLKFVIAEPEPELVPFRPPWLPIRSEPDYTPSRLRRVLIRWKAWLADSDAQ